MQKLLQFSLHLLDLVCKPDSHVIEERLQKQIRTTKNNSVLVMLILSSVAHGIFWPYLKGTSLEIHIIHALNLLILISSKLLFRRRHPLLVDIIATSLTIAYHPLMSYLCPKDVLLSLLLSSQFSLSILISCSTRAFYPISFISQLYFILTLYPERLNKVISTFEPSTLVQALISLTLFVHLNAFFTMTANSCLMKNLSRLLAEASKRGDELDKQQEFFLTLSHEIRNPLNALMGNLKLALNENSSPIVDDLLKTTNVCADMLLNLVNNVLDKSKAETGSLEVIPHPVTTSQLFDKIWNMCSILIRNKNLVGTLALSKALPENLHLDELRITQIILNLIGNAVKFTERGHVNVKAEWLRRKNRVTDDCFEPIPFDEDGIYDKKESTDYSDGSFDVYYTSGSRMMKPLLPSSPEEKGVLKISIRDSGVGMDEETIRNDIFLRFKQVCSDANKNKAGTGLGLYIAKELCLRMDGDIRVYSKPNYGTVFICCVVI